MLLPRELAWPSPSSARHASWAHFLPRACIIPAISFLVRPAPVCPNSMHHPCHLPHTSTASSCHGWTLRPSLLQLLPTCKTYRAILLATDSNLPSASSKLPCLTVAPVRLHDWPVAHVAPRPAGLHVVHRSFHLLHRDSQVNSASTAPQV